MNNSSIPGEPIPSEYDNSLFPDASAQQEATSVWEDGKAALEKGNPVGTFNAVITDATLGHSASSGRLQITYKLTILVGANKDSIIFKYDGLSTPAQAKITQQQLQRLGVNTTRLSIGQLPAVLLDLQNKQVQIVCKQNGQFYNIFFNKIIAPDSTAGLGTPAITRPPGASGAKKTF